MPFDFKGTFNKSQFNRLTTFVQSQLPILQARITHLTAEQARIGYLSMTFDPTSGQPLNYTPDSSTSYIGQLLLAYEAMGGDPLHDLQVRSMSDPVYLVKADEATPANMMSNGEPVGMKGLADAVSGGLIDQLRSFVDDTLHRRRDYLERKIRRMIDYSDQLSTEIALLNTVVQGVAADGSVQNIISQVQQLFTDPQYRAIWDDNGSDIYGKYSYAPFSAYEPGGTRPPTSGPERTESGVVLPGNTSSASTSGK